MRVGAFLCWKFVRTAMAALLALSLVACASAPVTHNSAPSAAGARELAPVNLSANAPMVGAMAFRVQGAVPVVGDSVPAAFSSDISIGDRSSPIRYQVSYAVSPGDVLSSIGSDISRAPTGLARQRTRQQVTMSSPTVVGAPLRLDLSTETTGNWTTGGYRASQRERAELRWSQRRADIRLQWSGAGAQRDQSLALDCDLQGTVRLPVSGGDERPSRSFNLSGRDCVVRSPRAARMGLGAQHWGVGYSWADPGLESEIVLSMINPVTDLPDSHAIYDSGYELGLRHSRQYGGWRANARVALRQPATVTQIYGSGTPGMQWPGGGEADLRWTADTSLVRDLNRMSVSASWTYGADPLWFMNEAGTRTDRLGVALDMSGWAGLWFPELQPQLSMRWRWSHMHSSMNAQRNVNELAVSMSVAW
jgi:hypothetical protein